MSEIPSQTEELRPISNYIVRQMVLEVSMRSTSNDLPFQVSLDLVSHVKSTVVQRACVETMTAVGVSRRSLRDVLTSIVSLKDWIGCGSICFVELYARYVTEISIAKSSFESINESKFECCSSSLDCTGNYDYPTTSQQSSLIFRSNKQKCEFVYCESGFQLRIFHDSASRCCSVDGMLGSFLGTVRS